MVGMLLVIDASFAESITLMGTTQQFISRTPVFHAGRRLPTAAANAKQQVTLLKVTLSNTAKAAVRARLSSAQSNKLTTVNPNFGYYPRQVQLGMNGVPVLDQGLHGSCVLFATTAAVDAVIGQGDYISQLCQLELGTYLQNNSYAMSGWDGSLGKYVAGQLEMFGVVPKSIQLKNGCAGVTDYPLGGQSVFEELSVFDYHQMSESLADHGVTIEPLMLPEQVNASFQDQERLLFKIKRILNQGDRVTIGVFIIGLNRGNVGALGTHHVSNDTWVMTAQNSDDFNDEETFGLHELIITGYDDDAIATDASGRVSRGLLTLRNSWSDQVGDQGDFYMSYTYFKAFLMEAQHIRQNRQ
jgi:hypothetical protein